MALFDDNLVYPCDHFGVYTEVTVKAFGEASPLTSNQYFIEVLVPGHGKLTAFGIGTPPKVGYAVSFRIYRYGSKDNIITSWSAPIPPCQACGTTTGVAYEDARTAYEVPEPTFWDKVRGETPDLPNQPLPLCRPCATEHHAQWDAVWQEYRSGLL